MNNSIYALLTIKAETLVRETIQGHRKGMPDEPNYLHSFRVRDLVSEHHHWDDPDYDLFLAALLHDVIEDGGVTFDDLRSMGCSERTIELIDLCTHQSNIEDKTERWTLMIARLIEARNEDAWRIKLADLTDNLKQSRGLSAENRQFMTEVKAPLMLRLVKALPFNRWITEEYPHVQPSIFALEAEMISQRLDMKGEGS
jgi:(p)ppGpp synthase/HD superfamily hydrolase